jgi:hypothetical protein
MAKVDPRLLASSRQFDMLYEAVERAIDLIESDKGPEAAKELRAAIGQEKCECPCHTGEQGIIMHDKPCCEEYDRRHGPHGPVGVTGPTGPIPPGHETQD